MPIHVVLDTSVLIAALRSRRGASFEVLRLVGDERWRLHLSTALLLEYVAVREAEHFWAMPDLIDHVLDYLCAHADQHAISFRWRPFLNPDRIECRR
jgi:predicted nucleic acid-binding protein